MGLIRFILIVGGLYLLFKVLGYWLRANLPRLVQKMYQNSYQRQSSAYNQNKQQGEVIINKNQPQQTKRFDKDQGEYVDYEEVKD